MNDLIFRNIDKELERIAEECLQGKEVVVTKFGNARMYNKGYYEITSYKERNKGKFLHRLIWEDYYGKSVPEGYDIHHINGDKLDNRIQNLQCVEHSLHLKFHKKGKNNPNFGKPLSEETRRKISEEHKGKRLGKNHPMWNKHHLEETKIKISKVRNTTGYYGVTKIKDKSCKHGFIWRYRYPDENGKRKSIERVNLDDLEKEVKKRGLLWIELGDD